MVVGFQLDVTRGYGNIKSQNAVIHAENSDALRRLALERDVGPFRCIYFDPPFNSRRRFDEYDDALDPAVWRRMMSERLVLARDLLSEDGAIVVEIDDTELGSLCGSMDEVFGRGQRVSIVTVVRSAATGHKARNPGPVNVADYLLVYTKNRTSWRYNRLYRERDSYDRAYSSWLKNPDDPVENWGFVSLASHVRAQLGASADRRRIEEYAVEHASQVVRFAQPRYEAVSREARALIDRSRCEPDRGFRLVRKGLKDIILVRGNRVLFLEHKVHRLLGRTVLVEPLTNVWTDIGFQGIAKEGATRFSRNKKPERLLARIIAATTDPGDWVLDAYLGSGTTAAVAQKMGRRWVGIERGSHVDTMCLPRLRRVVDGNDSTGITEEMGWRGGGGFHVWT